MNRRFHMPIYGDMRDMRRSRRGGRGRRRDRSDYANQYSMTRKDSDMEYRDSRDYARNKDYRGGDYNYREDYEGRGDYARRRRDRADYDYEEDDERDYGYEEDYYDYADMPKLTKRDIMEWKHELMNADGTKGEHFKMEHIEKVAKDMGIRFNEYDEKELCITVNMLYSDYCQVLKSFISPEKEIYLYVAMAKAFLEDEDAPEGSEKLALYYHCIVNA